MATVVKQPQLDTPVFDFSMARQAIMNGNFDVWQRGTTSSAIPDATRVYTADRWFDDHQDNGGTLPTLIRSRQALTAGSILNSYYYTRLNSNGAGSGLGANAYGQMVQPIEHGTRFLCGASKKVTISFYARSDIANKKLGVWLYQTYGTGGSPSTAENVTGTYWTLTSNWTRYTATITTNTLSGKTFGTLNDDYLGLSFLSSWGSSLAYLVGDSVAETYVGSGNIDIAQVQLCAGDVALPFQPKSFGRELTDCQRFAVFYTIPANSSIGLYGPELSTTHAYPLLPITTPMRLQPNLVVTASDWILSDGGATYDCTNIVINNSMPQYNCVRVQLDCTVSGTMFSNGRMAILAADSGGTRVIGLEIDF